MIGKTLAHYEITAKIGEGGMGEVYRAHDTKLDRDVALKILPRALSGDRERSARFEREARTLASLQHANIASIYGYEEVDGVRFLAMELVEGEDLAERLGRGPLPMDEALAIGLQIAIGLEAAHERNIVHRDLKPANVKVTPEGVVKILDFGLARAYTGDPDDDSNPALSPTITAAMTQAGVILGTAAYMSPEQARGKSIDKRSDIWSFGVMLYEMLTRIQLYSGETVTDILGAIVHSNPDFGRLPANLPPAVRALLERCLTSDVHERLRDIGEARIVLGDPRAPGFRVATPAAARPARGWMVASVVLAVATLALGARLWFAPATPERVVHATLELPPGHAAVTTGSGGGSLRLSPDGSAVAFVAQKEGNRQIWVRSLDQAEGHPVQGTSGGHRPFWSPDGRSLGFFVAGSLRRVAVSGGAPLTIAGAADGRGGVWLDNGQIVFAPTPGSALFAVPAGGGEIRQVTEPGNRAHREPRRLPGKGNFLFIEDRGGGEWTICVGNTDARPHVVVGGTGSGAEYASGRLLFLRARTLVAQPFDLGKLQLTGEPTPLAENVIRDSNYGIGVFSAAEGGVLCYQTGSGAGAQLKWVDRAGNEVAVQSKRADYTQMRLSPDGRTIATAVDDISGNSDLWLIDVERDTQQRFTFTPEGSSNRKSEPCWAPDGSRLVYAVESDGFTALYTKRVDGSASEELLLEVPDASLWCYDVSPDGKYALFGREEADSKEDLWIVPLDGGGEPQALFETPFDEWPGAFSPDGRWLAVDSDETGRREVYVIPFPEGPGRWQVSRDGARFPQWSADGTELYFMTTTGELMSTPVDITGRTFVCGEPKRLFQSDAGGGMSSLYDVDDSGGRILVLEQAAQYSSISLFENWDEALDGR